MASFSREEIAAQIAERWRDNSAGEISEADLRDVVSNLAASVLWRDENNAGGTNSTGSTGGTSGTGALRHVHAQTTAAAVWTIVHNFGRPPGSVRFLMADGTEVIGAGEYVDANTYRIEWAAPLTGSAILLA